MAGNLAAPCGPCAPGVGGAAVRPRARPPGPAAGMRRGRPSEPTMAGGLAAPCGPYAPGVGGAAVRPRYPHVSPGPGPSGTRARHGPPSPLALGAYDGGGPSGP